MQAKKNSYLSKKGAICENRAFFESMLAFSNLRRFAVDSPVSPSRNARGADGGNSVSLPVPRCSGALPAYNAAAPNNNTIAATVSLIFGLKGLVTRADNPFSLLMGADGSGEFVLMTAWYAKMYPCQEKIMKISLILSNCSN